MVNCSTKLGSWHPPNSGAGSEKPLSAAGTSPIAGFASSLSGAGITDLSATVDEQFRGFGGITPTPLGYLDIYTALFSVEGSPGDTVTLMPSGIFSPVTTTPSVTTLSSPALISTGDAAYNSLTGSTVPSSATTFVGGTITVVPEPSALAFLGLIGVVYLLARTGGKLLGAWGGARLSHANKEVQRWMGLALLPQAGVAIGMALVAANYFPEHRQLLLSVVISTTVIFEIIGPVFTRMAIFRAET